MRTDVSMNGNDSIERDGLPLKMWFVLEWHARRNKTPSEVFPVGFFDDEKTTIRCVSTNLAKGTRTHLNYPAKHCYSSLDMAASALSQLLIDVDKSREAQSAKKAAEKESEREYRAEVAQEKEMLRLEKQEQIDLFEARIDAAFGDLRSKDAYFLRAPRYFYAVFESIKEGRFADAQEYLKYASFFNHDGEDILKGMFARVRALIESPCDDDARNSIAWSFRGGFHHSFKYESFAGKYPSVAEMDRIFRMKALKYPEELVGAIRLDAASEIDPIISNDIDVTSNEVLSTQVIVTQFTRSVQIKAQVLLRASGRCEARGCEAPFVSDDDNPFFEVHHLKRLADGGSDRASNAIALCPNCHREMHFGKNKNALLSQMYEKFNFLVCEPS